MRFVAYFFCAAMAITLVFVGVGRPLGFQWDFFVYYNAALSWRLGLNPYDFRELGSRVSLELPPVMSFTYPPLLIPLFLPFTFFSQSTAAGLWLGGKLAFFALFLAGCRFLHRFHWRDPVDMALLFLGFNSALMSDFVAGNTSLPQFALLWLALALLARGRELGGGVLAGAASLVKVQPIALLAAGAFLPPRPRWRYVLAGLSVFTLFWILNRFFFPVLFREFLREAMHRVQGESGILAPSALALAQDLGRQLGLVSVLPEALRGRMFLLGWPLYGCVLMAVLPLSLLALRRLSGDPCGLPLALGILLLAFLLTAPRVKSYDYVLALPVAGFALRNMGERYRLAMLLLLCLPVIFPIVPGSALEIYSSAQLGAVKKVEYLFYQYLPFGNCLLLWIWHLKRSGVIRLQAGAKGVFPLAGE